MTIPPSLRDAINTYVATAVASDQAVTISDAAVAFAESHVDDFAADRPALLHLLTSETARRLKAQAKQPDPDQPRLFETARTIAPGVIKRTDACTFAELLASHEIKARNVSNVTNALERDRALLERFRPVMDGTDLTLAQAEQILTARSAA